MPPSDLSDGVFGRDRGGQRGLPQRTRVDNGTEFTGKRLDQSAYLNQVQLAFRRRGSPSYHRLIAAFNGWLRAECLNEHWLFSMKDAQRTVGRLGLGCAHSMAVPRNCPCIC